MAKKHETVPPAAEVNPLDAIDLGAYDSDEVLDLSGLPESPGFEALPPGTYNATLTNAEYRLALSSGKPMVNWEFTVTDGDFKGRKVFTNTVLHHEVGLQRLRQTIVALQPDFPLGAFKPKTDPLKLVGKPCRVKVGVKVQDGEKRNEVKAVLAATLDADGAGSNWL